MADAVMLTGKTLTLEALGAIAKGATVALAEDGIASMRAGRAVLVKALEEQRPMYGITTGLGPRVVERLSPDEQQRMSIRTIRGRAHSVGKPLPKRDVRAAMAVRANTLLIGGAGADPALAELIVNCLNAGLTPVIGETGSIGAADLMWGGNMGLALIGEGEMQTDAGRIDAGDALRSAGLEPYIPGPREGLALAANSSVVAGIAATGLMRAASVFESAQMAVAMSFEGFRGNLTPFDPDVLAIRPQPGQAAASEGVRERLAGSLLLQPGHARRVQDPLSLRNVPQVHGAVLTAMAHAQEAILTEINGSSDNPVVLVEREEILSSGGYLTPHLAIALGGVLQAFVHMAAAQAARMAKTLMPRFTELPVGLASGGVDSAGIAPSMKTAEALFSEIVQKAQPSPVYPGGAADGVEDIVAHSAIPAKMLHEICERMEMLTAMELIIGCQAVELRALDTVAPKVAEAMAVVRADVAPVVEDRSLSLDFEVIAERVRQGDFA